MNDTIFGLPIEIVDDLELPPMKLGSNIITEEDILEMINKVPVIFKDPLERSVEIWNEKHKYWYQELFIALLPFDIVRFDHDDSLIFTVMGYPYNNKEFLVEAITCVDYLYQYENYS